nr:hypothetical protein [Candidatus Sigynarchaeota archaeon]
MANTFPIDLFLRQYKAKFPGTTTPGNVDVRGLKSKKHATVEMAVDGFQGLASIARSGQVIAKYFDAKSNDALTKEREVLEAGAKAQLAMPRILICLENFIVMDKIDGVNACDAINSSDAFPEPTTQKWLSLNDKMNAIEGIGTWLARFHASFASHPGIHRHGDAILRNFVIAADGQVFGVDFEEVSGASREIDLAELMESLLTTEPGLFTQRAEEIEWKFDLCVRFLSAYEDAMTAANIPAGQGTARIIELVLDKIRISSLRRMKAIPQKVLHDIQARLDTHFKCR